LVVTNVTRKRKANGRAKAREANVKTKKHYDYLLFKEAVMIMQRGEHLTIEGIQKIVNIRASLNKGG
jgi:hypothetical protein